MKNPKRNQTVVFEATYRDGSTGPIYVPAVYLGRTRGGPSRAADDLADVVHYLRTCTPDPDEPVQKIPVAVKRIEILNDRAAP